MVRPRTSDKDAPVLARYSGGLTPAGQPVSQDWGPGQSLVIRGHGSQANSRIGRLCGQRQDGVEPPGSMPAVPSSDLSGRPVQQHFSGQSTPRTIDSPRERGSLTPFKEEARHERE
jgi:hypothetical protein